jgi:hypothetical protein
MKNPRLDGETQKRMFFFPSSKVLVVICRSQRILHHLRKWEEFVKYGFPLKSLEIKADTVENVFCSPSNVSFITDRSEPDL